MTNLTDPFLFGIFNEKEVKKVGNTPPKFSVGEIVDINTWTGMVYDFKVVDVKVTYHYRCNEYVWGYRLYKEGQTTGFSFEYIPEGYLRKKGEQ